MGILELPRYILWASTIGRLVSDSRSRIISHVDLAWDPLYYDSELTLVVGRVGVISVYHEVTPLAELEYIPGMDADQSALMFIGFSSFQEADPTSVGLF